MKIWAMAEYEKCSNYAKAARLLEPDLLKKREITYEKFISAAVTKYKDMVAAKRYEPALKATKSEEPTLPASYQAAITKGISNAIKQNRFQPKPNDGTPGGTGGGGGSQKGACWKCGSKDHIKKNCPKKGTQPQANEGGKDEWRTKPPSNPQNATIQKYGRTYKWCSKCNNGKGQFMYHFADKHDAWLERRKERARQGQPNTTAGGGGNTQPQAILAEGDVVEDDFIFGGLVGLRG